MDIGNRIRFVRQLRGMTQLELATKIGLPDNESGRIRITRYETGKSIPKEDTLEKISDALNINSLYLSTKEHTPLLDLTFFLFELDMDKSILINKKDNHYFIDFDNWILNNLFEEWMQKKEDLNEGKITEEEYIEWKINYTGK